MRSLCVYFVGIKSFIIGISAFFLLPFDTLCFLNTGSLGGFIALFLSITSLNASWARMTFLSAASVHRSHFLQVDLDASELLQAVGGDVGTAPGAAGKKRTLVSVTVCKRSSAIKARYY